MARKHLLAEMTFREFADRLPESPVILLPLGSQEEQGPDAPMGDFLLTAAIAAQVAERADAIAAPTLPFGYADYFRPVPGGVALRPDTFCAVLRDVADNFLAHGLRGLVILNGHSGNAPMIDRTVRAIRAETGVVVPSINLWRLDTPAVWQRAFGGPPGARTGAGHGAQPVGSAYAHLFPALLRPDLTEPPRRRDRFLGFEVSGIGAVRFQGIEVAMPLDVTDVTENGVLGGDPLLTSAAAGRVLVEHIVDTCAAFVMAFRAALAAPALPEAKGGAA